MIAPDHDTTYQKIIKSLLSINPKMRIVGLTGSPYRADQGMIHDPVKDGNVIFTKCCYESDISRLINEGYLSSVQILNTHVSVNLDGVKIVRGDYDQSAAGVKFDAIVVDAVQDFKAIFAENNIKTALIFASTINNGQRIVEEFGDNEQCKLAHGDLSTHERNELIRWLKDGEGNRYLVNVGLYTRGFDFPKLEALVLLRATNSLRLYVQIIGRLLRTHEEKAFGFLADYGTNVERFGPIDNLTPPKPPSNGEAPQKLCLLCDTVNRLSAKFCKECGAEFVNDSEDGNYSMRSKAQILAAKLEAQTIRYEVDGIIYERAYSRAAGLPMIKALFYDQDAELIHTHYLCLDHSGYAGDKAQRFMMALFKDMSDYAELGIAGVNVNNCLELLNNNPEYFKKPSAVILAPGSNSKFKELKSVEYKNND
jgi:DNA repair protein RadD